MPGPLLSTYTYQSFPYRGLVLYSVTDFPFWYVVLLDPSDIRYTEINVKLQMSNSLGDIQFLSLIHILNFGINYSYNDTDQYYKPIVHITSLPPIPMGYSIDKVIVYRDTPLIQSVSLNNYNPTSTTDIGMIMNRQMAILQEMGFKLKSTLGHDPIEDELKNIQIKLGNAIDKFYAQWQMVSPGVYQLSSVKLIDDINVTNATVFSAQKVVDLINTVSDRLSGLINQLALAVTQLTKLINDIDTSIPNRVDSAITNRIIDDKTQVDTTSLYSNEYTETRISDGITERIIDDSTKTSPTGLYSNEYIETRINEAAFPEPTRYQTDLSITDASDPKYLGGRDTLYAGPTITPDSVAVTAGNNPNQIANKVAYLQQNSGQVQSDASLVPDPENKASILNPTKLLSTSDSFTPVDYRGEIWGRYNTISKNEKIEDSLIKISEALSILEKRSLINYISSTLAFLSSNTIINPGSNRIKNFIYLPYYNTQAFIGDRSQYCFNVIVNNNQDINLSIVIFPNSFIINPSSYPQQNAMPLYLIDYDKYFINGQDIRNATVVATTYGPLKFSLTNMSSNRINVNRASPIFTIDSGYKIEILCDNLTGVLTQISNIKLIS